MKIATFFFAIFVTACATQPVAESPASNVRFGLETVSPGVVRLTLDNGSRNQIGYNLCSSRLQRRDGSTWIDVPTDEVCTMEIRSLQPGADATFEKRLPTTLEGGEYRYVTSVEDPLGTSAVRIATDAFLINPD